MHKKPHVLLASLWALACLLSLPGCIVVPLRIPTVIKNPAGKNGSLPVEALVPGRTTREQIDAQYKGFAVDSGIPSLFWARFRKSKWAVVGGIYGVGAGGGRLWGAYNLLATFDEDGTLAAFETVSESKLYAKLVAMQTTHQLPLLDLSQPIPVSGMTNFPRGETIDFQLSAREAVITTHPVLYRVPKKPPPPPKVGSIPIAQVIALKIRPQDEDVSEIALEMQFSAKTTFGKKLFFTAKPDAAITLVRWLEQEKTRSNSEYATAGRIPASSPRERLNTFGQVTLDLK